MISSENEMNQITQNSYQDLDKITNQFLSVLENQGVDSSVLEQLLSSLQYSFLFKQTFINHFDKNFNSSIPYMTVLTSQTRTTLSV